MKEPKVLTRMRLCECWGDSLDIEEIKEVNNYIENLQRETQKLEKQLEQGKEQYNDLVKEKEELKTLYDSTILEKENQQLKEQNRKVEKL